jgi:O-antigen/teichoic acid export membrane protein
METILIIVTKLVITSILNWLLHKKSLKYVQNNVVDPRIRRYGYFLTTTSIVGTIVQYADRILIGILMGPVELAIYYIAITIPTQIKDFLKIGISPLTPIISRDNVKMGLIIARVKKIHFLLIHTINIGINTILDFH